MLPKFVPMPDPGLVDRVTEVISRNPTGVKKASPSLNCSGLDVSLEAGCGGGVIDIGVGAGVFGNIGVVLAISGRVAGSSTRGPAALPSLEVAAAWERPCSCGFDNASSRRV